MEDNAIEAERGQVVPPSRDHPAVDAYEVGGGQQQDDRLAALEAENERLAAENDQLRRVLRTVVELASASWEAATELS